MSSTILPAITEGTFDGVTVIGAPKSNKKSSIVLKGKNNVIELIGLPTLDNLKIELIGDGNRLRIGKNTRAKGVFTLGEGSTMTLGDGVTITRPSHFVAREGTSITIGNRCLISNVTVMSTDVHSIFDRTSGARLNRAKSVEIGDMVWLAEHVAVYKGAIIGSGSVIGAHAMVRGTIPANVVAAGAPADVIRTNIIWDRRLLPDGAHLLSAA